MKKNSTYLCVFLIVLILPFRLAAQVNDTIRVQLKWWHQFQFAGYYAAEIKGFYKEAGLTVSLIPGDKDHSPLKEIVNNNADFGVAGSEILLDYLNGTPIQVISVIFQHSPYVIISPEQNHITVPKDLLGKRVMISGSQGWVQLKALLIKEGIDPHSIRTIPHTWNNNDLLNGTADAMSGYSSVEALQLEQVGIKVNILKPADYGVDFYGDVIFGLQRTIHNNEDITNKFKAATLKGWEYAMANPHEITQYILTLPGVKERGVTVRALMQEASKMQELVVPKLVEMGHMNAGRWEKMLNVYKSLHLVSKDKQLGSFLYEKESASNRYLKIGSYVLIAVLCILFLLFIYSANMKKAVKNRTTELENEIKLRKENEQSFKKLSEELQISNNELKQFAYLTSHNLRAPVTNLLSLVRLFNTQDLSEKNEAYFKKIDTCTVNLNTMLKDLNEVLSVRTELCADKMILDLETELTTVEESISEEILNTGTLITKDFKGATSLLYVRKNIHSIFQNLIINAIKYRKKGVPAHINISARKEGADIKITFSDNGTGINMQRYGDKIFGIYQRFHKDIDGKGLGLYIVKTQVEKCGGRIQVESTENEGTKFIITLKNCDPYEQQTA
jgi:signal transduction histidine kinase/ABC-type nitrate/sulfonate/bicarbonate transport system substrate-binding protein